MTPDSLADSDDWAPVAAERATTAAPVDGGSTTTHLTTTLPDVAPMIPPPFVEPTAAWIPGGVPVASTPAGASTAHQLAKAAPPVVGTAASVAALSPGWTVRAELAAPGAPIDIASADYEPMARSYVGSAAAPPYPMRRSTSSATVGSWALALLPLVIGAAAASVVTLIVIPDPELLSQPTPILIAGAAIAAGALLWVILFAALDRAGLGRLGHDRRPSILWAVLLGPLAYLIARIVALRGTGARSAAPLIGYLIATVLVSVGAGFVLGSVAATLVTGSSIATIESTVANSLADEGMDYVVFCPSGIELVSDAVLVCEAHDDLGVAALVEVTITDPAGAFDYRMI